ncbi:hypothetical protein FHS19_004156 [Paenibacillus rhizosphaerae]|uniref:Uncharacterized protein n=1 Tax=Paenibacillus rhizosphaerae TaxID=297318 RepID=A0A839TSG0_9BACL|nr:hypothetical protein [Paenibacillus rhizosphaerae]MBB3129481.1 hypothetical protein [Paenibacillus rhizosphaerae]
MPICINQNGDVFDEFLRVSEEEAAQMSLDFPITHALVVAKNKAAPQYMEKSLGITRRNIGT